MIMYQAKVNRSEYDYVYKNYADETILSAALKTTGDNIKNNNYYFPPTADGSMNCNCPAGIFCFPCGENGESEEGAIEIKTGWRLARDGDDINQFFHREAMYLVNGATTPTMEIFLLVGMHIIHKTVNMPEFIFATWEHESVDAGIGDEEYTYIPIRGNDTTTVGGRIIIEEKGAPKAIIPTLIRHLIKLSNKTNVERKKKTSKVPSLPQLGGLFWILFKKEKAFSINRKDLSSYVIFHSTLAL